MIERFLILWHFAVTRWMPKPPCREKLLASQQRKLRRFLTTLTRECAFYRGLPPEPGAMPVMEKETYLANFTVLNRHGVTLEQASEAALRAERERDFRPQLPGGLTVGLSSGTSGNRHVFLVSRADRCRWAGQSLARLLSAESLRQVLNPFAPPLRIAFFLRASSNLYTTLSSRRVRFRYFDLTRPFDDLLDELAEFSPDVLIAPATVLAEMARRDLRCRPRQVISVAEVLDARDRQEIERAFHVRVAEVYQAAEGFLGSSCEAGRIHLHEDALHIEPAWLDDRHDRFQPVVTDFSRGAQWFVRYRMEDVLRADPTPCPCGRATLSLQAIEGRTGEVLWLPDFHGVLSPVFPDVLRQALYAIPDPPRNYRIEQHGGCWEIRLLDGDPELVRAAIGRLAEGLMLEKPRLDFLPWTDPPRSEKQKRIRCLAKPA